MTDIIRVVLADDHVELRARFKEMLGSEKDIQVIGEADNGREAVSIVSRMDPDVLVMDLSMEPVDGMEATKELIAARVRTKILILTTHSPQDMLILLLDAGASGFLEKIAADCLVDAVRAVAHGDTFVQPSAAGALAGKVRKAKDLDEQLYAPPKPVAALDPITAVGSAVD